MSIDNQFGARIVIAKVAVFGILRFPPETVQDVLPHLRVLVETTYKNDGCIVYDVALDPFDAGLIRFSELWPDRESLNKHLVAPHIEPWRAAARACGLLERKFFSYNLASEAIAV
ncbi:MAG: antibiotic biosynthesis monooxygenase [Gammaproteobacteria bacterium]|nr:antibiotic biosynthesis monooxygenase [Gammaproteobacteria bacterium]